MNDSITRRPSVFISYSWDSPEHKVLVLGLSERLRNDGIETRLDQYVNGTPPEGWPRWMLNQIDDADFVLLICTPTYYRRFRGREVPGIGLGADWEGAIITQEIFEVRSTTNKFVPTLIDETHRHFVPEPVRGRISYLWTTKQGYLDLYDFLHGQAGVEARPVGERMFRPIKRGEPLTFQGELPGKPAPRNPVPHSPSPDAVASSEPSKEADFKEQKLSAPTDPSTESASLKLWLLGILGVSFAAVLVHWDPCGRSERVALCGRIKIGEQYIAQGVWKLAANTFAEAADAGGNCGLPATDELDSARRDLEIARRPNAEQPMARYRLAAQEFAEYFVTQERLRGTCSDEQ